jgi:hypothetical protein
MKVRRPAVAGQFYPAIRDELIETIEYCFMHELGPKKKPPAKDADSKFLAFVCPHAGYVYSGPVAAHSYYYASAISDVELFVIIGPNHWGLGSGVSVYGEGRWITPLGEVEVDTEAAKELVEGSGIVDVDETAHLKEHSIEVQLPFIQYSFPSKSYKILPITMFLQDKDTAKEIGKALASIARNRKALLLASSDFTHYEPHDQAKTKDTRLIESIKKLNVNDFYFSLARLNASACGYGPIASIIIASKELGAKEVKLLKYATSGDVTGDKSAVVGYASLMFVKG